MYTAADKIRAEIFIIHMNKKKSMYYWVSIYLPGLKTIGKYFQLGTTIYQRLLLLHVRQGIFQRI